MAYLWAETDENFVRVWIADLDYPSNDSRYTNFHFRVDESGTSPWQAYNNLDYEDGSNAYAINSGWFLGLDYDTQYYVDGSVTFNGQLYLLDRITVATESGYYKPNWVTSSFPQRVSQMALVNGSYVEIGSCAACAFSTMMQIHKYLADLEKVYYSITWVFGNRPDRTTDDWGNPIDNDEWADTSDVLNKLVEDGIPDYHFLIENWEYASADNWYWPDNRYYYDHHYNSGHGAKAIVDACRSTYLSVAQRSTISYYNLNYDYWAWADAKEAIETNGCVIFIIQAYSDFDACADDGILPMSCIGTYINNHMLVGIGWKLIGDEPYWICINSWGSNHGDGGLYYLPFRANYFSALLTVEPGDFTTGVLNAPALNTNATVKTTTSFSVTAAPVTNGVFYMVDVYQGATHIANATHVKTELTFTFNGLIPNTQYTIKIHAEAPCHAHSSENIYYVTTDAAAADFTWSTTLYKGGPLPNHNDWINLINFIIAAHQRILGSYSSTNYPMDTWWTVNYYPLSATQFNQVRAAIGAVNSSCLTAVTLKSAGSVLTAADLNMFMTKINEV